MEEDEGEEPDISNLRAAGEPDNYSVDGSE